MSHRIRYVGRSLVGLGLMLSFWMLTTQPSGLGLFQLLVFMAPGALLGLGANWVAYASAPAEWSWWRARRAAIIGGAVLPPVLAILVALDGNARPQRLLVGFVYFAWISLLGGAVFALLHHRRRRARIRGHARAVPPRVPPPVATTNG